MISDGPPKWWNGPRPPTPVETLRRIEHLENVLAALTEGIGKEVFWNDSHVPFVIASVDRAAMVAANAAVEGR